MGEVGKERIIVARGEGSKFGIQGLVDRGVVLNRRVCHAGNELIDEADSLRGTQRVAGSIAVVFP